MDRNDEAINVFLYLVTCLKQSVVKEYSEREAVSFLNRLKVDIINKQIIQL